MRRGRRPAKPLGFATRQPIEWRHTTRIQVERGKLKHTNKRMQFCYPPPPTSQAIRDVRSRPALGAGRTCRASHEWSYVHVVVAPREKNGGLRAESSRPALPLRRDQLDNRNWSEGTALERTYIQLCRYNTCSKHGQIQRMLSTSSNTPDASAGYPCGERRRPTPWRAKRPSPSSGSKRKACIAHPGASGAKALHKQNNMTLDGGVVRCGQSRPTVM